MRVTKLKVFELLNRLNSLEGAIRGIRTGLAEAEQNSEMDSAAFQWMSVEELATHINFDAWFARRNDDWATSQDVERILTAALVDTEGE